MLATAQVLSSNIAITAHWPGSSRRLCTARRIGFCLVLMVLAPDHSTCSDKARNPARIRQTLDQRRKQGSVSNMASTYVPLDSWVYPAFDRLAALGYVQTDFVGLRPWTRMECARLLRKPSERTADRGADSEAEALVS